MVSASVLVAYAFRLGVALVAWRAANRTFAETNTPWRTAARVAAVVITLALLSAYGAGRVRDWDCDPDPLYGGCSSAEVLVSAERRVRAAALILLWVGLPVAAAGWRHRRRFPDPDRSATARPRDESIPLPRPRSGDQPARSSPDVATRPTPNPLPSSTFPSDSPPGYDPDDSLMDRYIETVRRLPPVRRDTDGRISREPDLASEPIRERGLSTREPRAHQSAVNNGAETAKASNERPPGAARLPAPTVRSSDWDNPELRAKLRVGTVLETYDFGYISVVEVTPDGVIGRTVVEPGSLWTWGALSSYGCTIYSQPGDESREGARPAAPSAVVTERGGRLPHLDGIGAARHNGGSPGAAPEERGAAIDAASLDEAIAAALVRLIPTTWPLTSLEVRVPEGGEGQLTLTISGPAGDPTPVSATDELRRAVAVLYDFTNQCQWTPWRGLSFAVSRTEPHGWRYDVQFHYT